MFKICEWLGCTFHKQGYNSLQDDSLDLKKHESDPKIPDQGDETFSALKKWELQFPKNKCEIGGVSKTYDYSQKVLRGLLNSRALSKSNADEIGCHLWTISKASEDVIGDNIMNSFFIDSLPTILGKENKDIAGDIYIAMIGSKNRQTYSES